MLYSIYRGQGHEQQSAMLVPRQSKARIHMARRAYTDYDAQWDQPQGDYGGYDEYDSQYDVVPYEQRGLAPLEDAPPVPSLVGVSATITNYGSPLLSYTRTMQRFYQSRKRVLSMGRIKCAICEERIGGWAWLGPDNTSHAHDGCYDRLAWAWATVYAEQQHMAARGEID
jgi:hypothetical protein